MVVPESECCMGVTNCCVVSTGREGASVGIEEVDDGKGCLGVITRACNANVDTLQNRVGF